jgi:hypothetical protein
MKHLFKSLIAFCLFGYGTTIMAQSTIPASGGNSTGSGGSVSYSAGQVVYNKNTGANGSEIQGVQQPYEISVVTGIKDADFIKLDIAAYPNPATDFLRLRIENYEIDDLTYQLFDIYGNAILIKKIEGNETNISLQTLLPATYILKISLGNKVAKTFKIIKN